MIREVIYIGNDFYFETGTAMSCVYEKVYNGFKRFDWGFMEMAVKNGDSINLRPATDNEREHFIKIRDKFIRENNMRKQK